MPQKIPNHRPARPVAPPRGPRPPPGHRPPPAPPPPPAAAATPPGGAERYVDKLRRQYPASQLGVGGGWSSPKLELPAAPAFEAIERALVTCIRRVED